MNSRRHSSVGPLGQTIVCIAIVCFTAPAMAASVSYQVTDLADTTPGQDLWRIDYLVSGPLSQDNQINLLFLPSVFSDVNLVSNSAQAQIDVAPVIQPDIGLPADGELTLTALTELDAKFKGHVEVNVVWSGTGKPGAQSFEVLDSSFNVSASGQTTAVSSVPEPDMAWLMLSGLGITGLILRRR